MRTSLLLLGLLTTLARADVGGVWTPIAPLNTARQEIGASRSGPWIVVTGGLIGPGLQATATIETLFLNSGDVPDPLGWIPRAPMPQPRDHHAVCTASGGRVYVIGGFAGDFQAKSTVFAFEPLTDSWAVRAPLPAARGASWAVPLGQRIYVFGGVDAAGVVKSTTFIYDSGTNTWSQGMDMPTAREHLTAAALGNFIHVVGGRNGNSVGAHERYDPSLDQWTVLAPLPTPRSATATAVLGGRLFVMGGEIPQLYAVNEVYEPVTNTWSAQDPMPIPRHGVAAIPLADRILVIGGGIVQGLLPSAYVDTFQPLTVGAQHACECSAGAPCGNTASESGCRNSTGLGAELTGVGRASIGNDSLVVVATQLPPTSPALFFQGSALANGGAGVPFADGLRCASGTVVRIAMKTASGGIVRYPEGGNSAVSVRGNVSSATTRHYQVWYRNVGGPCGADSNLTNALTVDWML